MSLLLSRRALMALGAAAVLPLSQARAAPTPATSPADAAFDALGKDWLETSARLSPIWATAMGDHRYDAQVDDLSPAGWAAKAAASAALLARLEAIETSALSRDRQVDAALLRNSLAGDVWSAQTLQAHAWDPLIHNEMAGGALYSLIARDFAPITARLASATARMEAYPALLAGTRATLVPARTPKIHAQTVAGQNAGLVSLVDLLLAEADALSGPERARLQAAAATAKAAIAEHQAWIDGTLVPQAAGEWRLGTDLYDAKLRFALNSSLSRAEIKAAAEQALADIRSEMYGLSREVLAGRPEAPALPEAPTDEERQAAIAAAMEFVYADRATPETLVEVCEAKLAAAIEFVATHPIVTPPTEPVELVLTPEFQRGVAVAYCDPPGPLDRGLPTFYKISPIPEDWTAEQADSFLREYNNWTLEGLTTHEATPGHYLQLAHSNRYPSILRSVLWSGPFVEGWACYAQDVMVEAGHRDGHPLYRLANLKFLLRVVANALLDIGVHVEGWDEARAMRLMTHDAFQQEREAAGKWTRARVSSAQLPTYFVGWREHWALRREAEQKAGAAFDMKAYHDQVLGYGSPPVRFTRQLMFDLPIA
ncbi:DUF885 domain-containing protein [Phenylobacterium sp.]|uniref:DUF885 domain-containing protein n=1 Tax=Phenylobacterium sp. TaxID=1871053 RepID=UPI0019A8EC26|nr:DUF885 domain-containing protein [Phenylobacterium sp.]MBC7168479.1 DUF885 domain-containing protein [Phenylobacterium sp.]